MHKIPVFVSLALVGSSLLATPTAEANLPKPVKHGYVVSKITLPLSGSQADQLGVDVDGDGTVDNQLGHALGALSSQGFDIQGGVDAVVSGGQLVTLLSVRTTSLKNAKGVEVKLLKGVATANPDLDGGGRFKVDKAAPANILKAKIKNKVLVTKPKTMTVTFPPVLDGMAPVLLTVFRGQIITKCTSKGCKNGVLGGGVARSQIDTTLIPAIGALARAAVARDCTGTTSDTCESGSQGKTFLDLFDANHDGLITDEEVRTNPIINGLFAPDLDLDHDGEGDTLSLGYGFTARWAKVRGD